eukprot:GHRQ01014674.1.p2 GENE.GHRQ01014674.1~~GHRQ01014674.1.p2  ORF type:complete len:112 (-),score=11.39 GHRQ01014674.1:700-1035(-)
MTTQLDRTMPDMGLVYAASSAGEAAAAEVSVPAVRLPPWCGRGSHIWCCCPHCLSPQLGPARLPERVWHPTRLPELQSGAHLLHLLYAVDAAGHAGRAVNNPLRQSSVLKA